MYKLLLVSWYLYEYQLLHHKVVDPLSLEIPCQKLDLKTKRTLPVFASESLVVTTSNPITFYSSIQSAHSVTVPTCSGAVLQPQVVVTKATTHIDPYLADALNSRLRQVMYATSNKMILDGK